AGDRRRTREIGVGEILHHVGAEPILIIEDVVGDPQPVGHPTRIMYVLTGAAAAWAVDRRAVIVELKGDADDVIALAYQQAGGDAAVHAARHGDDHACGRR